MHIVKMMKKIIMICDLVYLLKSFASKLPAYHCHPLASKWALSQYLNIAWLTC